MPKTLKGDSQMNMHSSFTAPASLADHAVLANLSIRQWTARKFDARASQEVTAANNANIAAARVNKRLLAKAALARVQSAVSSARQEHDTLTLPWGLRGVSILAMPGFLAYRERMAKHQAEFESAVTELCSNYESLRDAARSELGELFSASDYPQSIRERFSFHVSFLPVPSANDFRVNLPDRDLGEIRSAIEQETREATNAAIRAIYDRASDCLTTMADTLARYEPGVDGTRAKGSFHGTLVTNVRKLAETLPLLNVFNDPRIDTLAATMVKIADIEAKDLKDSDALRADTEKQARAAVTEIAATVADFL